MAHDLGGLTIAVLGGDQREVVLIKALHDLGAHVRVVGFLELPELTGTEPFPNVPDAVTGVDAVIVPMSNTDEEGRIKAVMQEDLVLRLDEEAFSHIRPGTPLIIGMAKRAVEKLALQHQIPIIEAAEEDEIAILNSIPTAEGALARAMQEMPITIHGSRSLVLGFGRCAITLARVLKGLGARTAVLARDRGQLARAREMGMDAYTLSQLGQRVEDADVVFNSIPARILTEEVLRRMGKDAIIVDIASAPGGTDFEAAESLGIKAFLDLGIPGKVAPRTAGQILAETVPLLILDALRRAR